MQATWGCRSLAGGWRWPHRYPCGPGVVQLAISGRTLRKLGVFMMQYFWLIPIAAAHLNCALVSTLA